MTPAVHFKSFRDHKQAVGIAFVSEMVFEYSLEVLYYVITEHGEATGENQAPSGVHPPFWQTKLPR